MTNKRDIDQFLVGYRANLRRLMRNQKALGIKHDELRYINLADTEIVLYFVQKRNDNDT